MGWAASHDATGSELVVYLSADPGQSPHVLEYMKRETANLMQTAGYDVTWRDAQAQPPEDTSAELVVARLEGVCSLASGDLAGAASEKPVSLAATAVNGGHVLPYTSVNCGNVTRTVAAALGPEPAARRDYLYGRAVARVLAHEFYHILLGETAHASGGVAKPCFSPADLLTEHFAFDEATQARLQKHAPARAAEAVAADDDGRR